VGVGASVAVGAPEPVGALVGATAAIASEGLLDPSGATAMGVVSLNSAKLMADVRTALSTAASTATLTIR
jgi:hypothetical protein